MQNDLTRPIIGIENRTAQEVFDIMADRIRRLHGSAATAGVRAKALVWEEVHQRRSNEDPTTEVVGWEAETAFGSCYTIETRIGFELTHDYQKLGEHQTPDEAKAAAQADYEQRVLSALTQPERQAEAVGVTGTMPGTDGFSMAVFEAAKVPVGTPLYAAPQPDRGALIERLAGALGNLASMAAAGRVTLHDLNEAREALSATRDARAIRGMEEGEGR